MTRRIAFRERVVRSAAALLAVAGIVAAGAVYDSSTHPDRSAHPPSLTQLLDQRWQVGGYVDGRAHCRPAGAIALAGGMRRVSYCTNTLDGPVAAHQGFFVDLSGRAVDVTPRLTGHG